MGRAHTMGPGPEYENLSVVYGQAKIPMRIQKSGTLSGGEQQMVATARALCIQPKLLLMDEPSEGLMPSMIETIFETIEKLKKEKVGVLLVEQKIEGTLRVSDRIVFMENGFMREESDPQALVNNPEPLAKYVGVKAHVQ